jgi:hypothetical protein
MAYNGFRKAGGGGFLNGVTGKIIGITFDSKAWPAVGKKPAYSTLSAEVRIMQDGQTIAVQQFLKAGFLYDGQSVSKDGKTLTSDNDRPIITEDSDFGKFVMSILEANPDVEADLDPAGRTFEGLVGYRVTFAKVLDAETQIAIGTKRLGAKAKHSTAEEIMTAGKRQDKTDASKSYNVDYLAVSAVLGKEPVKGGKSASRTNGSGKVAATAAPTGGDGDTAAAADTVLSMLADAPDNTLETARLNSTLIKFAAASGMLREDREATARLLKDVAFLSSIEGVTFDKQAKTIALA